LFMVENAETVVYLKYTYVLKFSDKMLEDVDLNSDWKPPFVFLETSMGNITVELYWEHAPKACRNFAELAQLGYYDKTIFHRVISEALVQGGDPTGTGRGGTSVYGAPFEDEIDDRLKHTGAGIISMANSGPDSNCSQFFFTLAPAQWLDGKHTIFGRIYEGIKVLEKISMVSTDGNDRPLQPVQILKASTK
ncbi:Peptidyl-prolyl cis-trans isomerase-like 1, partial [Trichinella sp. T8]